jgi:hypothetical protein
MPRATPPDGLCPVIPQPFELSDDVRREIAAALGLSKLPPLMATVLEYNIGNYKTNTRQKVKATLGRTIAAIDEVLNAADAIEEALKPFTCPQRSGLGQGTYNALVPFATPLLGDLRTFRHKAKAQRKELDQSPPLPKNPQLRQLCLLLRAIYEAVQEARAAINEKELRAFALVILGAADIPRKDYGDYHIHPERLTELFNFDAVPSSDLRRYVNAELREEIDGLVR